MNSVWGAEELYNWDMGSIHSNLTSLVLPVLSAAPWYGKSCAFSETQRLLSSFLWLGGYGGDGGGFVFHVTARGTHALCAQ